jgi:pilus assembly protein Flp/PilA
MRKFIARFANDESGATAVEYGMIVALIAAVIVGVVTTLGTSIQGSFQTIADKLAPPA